jgi:hypothetical protein
MSVALRKLARWIRKRQRPVSALETLVRMIRNGQTRRLRYLELCVQVGLSTRAHQARAAIERERIPLSTDVRLAVMRRDFAEVHKLLKTNASWGSRLTRSDLSALVRDAASIAPTEVHRLLEAHPKHPASAAVLFALDRRADCEQRIMALRQSMGPDQWLLLSNLRDDSTSKLECLNQYLRAHGLHPVQLLDVERPPRVGNLQCNKSGVAPSMDRALLSVVMTVFNGACHIDAAAASILSQTYESLELIVVDDGSTDDTWHILEKLRTRDARVKLVRLPVNRGTYAAKNVGLSLATGEFISFHDSDDWAHIERFARCIAHLHENPRAIAVSCNYVRLRDDGLFMSVKTWPMTRWTPNSVVFRRQLVMDRIGYFDEQRVGGDSEYVARMRFAFGFDACVKIDLPLLIAAHRTDSLMHSANTGLDEYGLSTLRAEYQEQWLEFLIAQSLSGGDFYLPARTNLSVAEPQWLDASRADSCIGEKSAG